MIMKEKENAIDDQTSPSKAETPQEKQLNFI